MEQAVLGKRQQTILTMDSINDIPVVKSYKYLGIHIDNKLSVENHYNLVKPKISYVIYISIKMDTIA